MRIQLKTRGLVAAGDAKVALNGCIPYIEVTGLGPDFNEIVMYQMNEGSCLYGSGEDENDKPFEWLITHATSEELREAGLMDGWPHGSVSLNAEGPPYTMCAWQLANGRHSFADLSELEEEVGAFTLTAPEEPVTLNLEPPATPKPDHRTPAEQMCDAINTYLLQDADGCNMLSMGDLYHLRELLMHKNDAQSTYNAVQYLREVTRAKVDSTFNWNLNAEGNDFAAFMGYHFGTYTVHQQVEVGLKTCENIVKVLRDNIHDI